MVLILSLNARKARRTSAAGLAFGARGGMGQGLVAICAGAPPGAPVS
jgi:hypothetical protein